MESAKESKKIRSFIALELSDEARAELSRIEDILKEAGTDAKWVAPGSIHLTLKFLGYVPEEKIPSITERLKDIVSGISPFDVVLSDVGVFPSWSYVRVLWVGVGEGGDQVKTLADLVEKAMAEEGFEPEKRPFSPHLTVARIRTPKNKDKLEKAANSIHLKPASSHISRIVLFESELTPKGAIYTPLATLDFAG